MTSLLDNPEVECGAALLITYLRDLFQASPRENYNKVDILVLLETISRDTDLFPTGIGVEIWSL